MYENEQDVFEELNRKLSEENLDLTVICVGGFVLSHYGIRATLDIDAFYSRNHKIDVIIRDVGEKFGINTPEETWLNNSVENMNDQPPEKICDVLYDFSNLRILTPPLDYIAGMKLYSGRGQDLEDVASIIKKMRIADPEVLKEKLHDYGFSPVDESLLLEAFGIAYGMDWLESYYISHEEEINNSIKSF